MSGLASLRNAFRAISSLSCLLTILKWNAEGTSSINTVNEIRPQEYSEI